MFTRQTAKVELKRKGWSQRRAADELGVCLTHLNMVLNGRRESRRILRDIHAMPESPVPYRCSGFARKPHR